MAKIAWSTHALEQLDALLLPIWLDDPNQAGVVAGRIDEAIRRLALFPESAPIFSDCLRRLAIPGLPYSCFYEYADDDTVYIALIRHDRQRPLQ